VTESARLRAWIGLGGNLGDPVRTIESAMCELERVERSRLVRRSSLYRSAPWGGIEQPQFVNAVAELETRLGARELLDALLVIERRHGRTRDGVRWGPRTLDLDLILHGEHIVREDGLVVPHPRLAERAFVLAPMAELAPDLHVPGHGRVADLLARLDDVSCVRLEGDAARKE
jgi:2-amino-4-hydroxy-6-hydroxymethyldihydropteridine diphosphokinase